MLNTLSTAVLPPSLAPLPPVPKRQRGGQPLNQNTRKSGTFSRFHPGPLQPVQALVKRLNADLTNPLTPSDQVVQSARSARQALHQPSRSSFIAERQAIQIELKLNNILLLALAPLNAARGLHNALETLACSPIFWFEGAYLNSGISRDADSFFPVLKKSTQYSPVPPNHPHFATNLTDSQWAVIAPLIPPDPQLDWLTGDPPIMIAANRWGFTRYLYTGEFQDIVIMEKYHKIIQRCPGLSISPLQPERVSTRVEKLGRIVRGRGRPRTSPRALLNAIIWKMATGHTWDSIPPGFPPARMCGNYYRRLYLSGRWVTLILALYNHFCKEASADLVSFLENGVFTTTPAQRIALAPQVAPTWENCTALLFMQLARSAWSNCHRDYKQANPLFPLHPVFKDTDPLTTGLPPGQPLPHPPSKPRSGHSTSFQPLKESLAWKKWQKIEQDRQTIAPELCRRLYITVPHVSYDSSPPFHAEKSPPAQETGGITPGNAYNHPMNNMQQLSEDYTRIARAIRYIEENASRQPDLSELAARIGLSEYHFQRLFTRWAGISPKRFLQFLTRENAKALLAQSGNLLDATYSAGLSSPGRLHDLFVQTEAVTPGEFKTKGVGVEIVYGFHPSLFGECLLALTGRGICFLAFVDADRLSALENLRTAWPNAALTEAPARTAPIVDRIFSLGSTGPLPLHLRGTNFQIKVWEALVRLPAGRVTTYQALAEHLSASGAARAVGNAVAHNLVAYLIPCHRVLRKTGLFGNYRYGSTRKKAILGWEMAHIEK
jgi:AraC family transcriptional regulator of adaptative response/methylated-DNA-[protein]-cysteine methyltransferase